MLDDSSNMYNLYQKSPNANNTVRGNTDVNFRPAEYNDVRVAQQDEELTGKRADVYKALIKCAQLCKTGQKENYQKSLFMIKKLAAELQDLC